MAEPEEPHPAATAEAGNGRQLVVALAWPVLLLLALVLLSSIGLVAVALFSHIEPTSTIARMVGEGRSLTRMAAVVIIVPSLVVLTILDKCSGEVAATALSAIAGYVLGSSTGSQ